MYPGLMASPGDAYARNVNLERKKTLPSTQKNDQTKNEEQKSDNDNKKEWG